MDQRLLPCRQGRLWTPLNLILFNLVCSDFSVSVLGNPLTLTASLLRGWSFGKVLCVSYGFFMSLLGISSIITLTVLSFERFVMISKPFRSRPLSNKGAGLLVFAIWLYSFALTSPPLFGWGEYSYEAANISCSVNWESKSDNNTSYIVFLFAFGLVVPVFVICYSYFNIMHTMKKNALAMGSVSKAESRVAAMVLVMVTMFLVAWTPYSAFALIVAFGDPSLITPGTAVLPALMAKSSICYNPIIYVGLNTQFRHAWHQFLGVKSQSVTGSIEVGGENTAISMPQSNMITDNTITSTAPVHLRVQMSKSDKQFLQVKNSLASRFELVAVRAPVNSPNVSNSEQQL
ncbi:parapinopsin-like isoform X2 [Neocloeon triangulifer]|uniref:parapinopsin-like isoform X2 n=1 Tax=Neocloeon triangulifer TaxID=2078957 RepID=UPI00286F4040|nr:parapinopsin-like isoform X2 [Neocloeon triangulifer]